MASLWRLVAAWPRPAQSAARFLATAAAKEEPAAESALSVRMWEDGFAVVAFNPPNAKVYTIDAKLGHELEQVLNRVAGDPAIRSAVLISQKPSGFIAGADIHMLRACKTAEDAARLSRGGQQLCERLATLGKPVVAAIHGHCLGGGLELAMAATYRVATRDRATSSSLRK